MNTYFGLFKQDNIISTIKVKDYNISDIILEHNKDYPSLVYRDIEYYYNNDIDIKHYVDSYIIDQLFKEINANEPDNFFNSDYEVKLITSQSYRDQHNDYDNMCTFIEHVYKDKSEIDKKTIISKELLINKGFEDVTTQWEKDYYKTSESLDDYVMLRIWTDSADKNPGNVLKLDIDNRLTNSGRIWNLHIDNCDCCIIGCAEINNVWEFNTLMKVFGSKFRI